MRPNRSAQPYIIAVVIAAAMLLIAFSVYSAQGGGTYAPAVPMPSTKPLFTNPEVLKNWLPDSSYTYTIARIDDYLAQNQLTASSMSVVSGVIPQGNNYQLTVKLLPSGQLLALSIQINNYDPIISTAVSINGSLQSPTFNPSQTTTFTGITDLINSGLTTTEANNLQVAFTKFAPNAGNISIDPNSITHVRIDPSDPNPIISYTFSVKIDDTSYSALIHCPDLDSIQLILTSGNRHVFDSGSVNSQG